MRDFDDKQIQRDAARAARDGNGTEANPYLRAENMPSQTGESLADWARHHDTWREAYQDTLEPQAGHHKEVLPAAVLVTMVNRRLRWVPEVRHVIDSGDHPIRIHRPLKQERDPQGRNWDIDGFECGDIDSGACEPAFRRIVDRLRDEYDLR